MSVAHLVNGFVRIFGQKKEQIIPGKLRRMKSQIMGYGLRKIYIIKLKNILR